MRAGPLLVLAVVIAGAALLVWLHHLFWTWRLAAPTRPDALLAADTRDGWRIRLGRRLPRDPARRLPPVLLCHGISTNINSLDSGIERYSLSAFLVAAGLECFALELRGHGATQRLSRTAPRHWTFDTYVREDIPAALDAIREATGSEKVLWVGHSQGALLGMAACETYEERIAGLVAIAGPAHFDRQEDLRRLMRFSFVLDGRWNKFVAQSLAPFSGLWHPPVSELAINARNVEPAVYRRILANAVENIAPGVLSQFALWIRTDCFRSLDGAVDYRERLTTCRQPAFFVAAERDGLAPPQVVRSAFERWGGEKQYWSAGADYGHIDLIYGRRAPEEVFPRIRDWLLAHSRRA